MVIQKRVYAYILILAGSLLKFTVLADASVILGPPEPSYYIHTAGETGILPLSWGISGTSCYYMGLYVNSYPPYPRVKGLQLEPVNPWSTPSNPQCDRWIVLDNLDPCIIIVQSVKLGGDADWRSLTAMQPSQCQFTRTDDFRLVCSSDSLMRAGRNITRREFLFVGPNMNIISSGSDTSVLTTSQFGYHCWFYSSFSSDILKVDWWADVYTNPYSMEVLGFDVPESFPRTYATCSTASGYIEPILGDYVDLRWESPVQVSGARFVILRQKVGGEVLGNFEVIDTVPVKDWTCVAGTTTDPRSDCPCTGTGRWPAEGELLTEYYAGTYSLGLEDAQGHIVLGSSSFTVRPTVYDVYSSQTPFVIGSDSMTINYRLSSPVSYLSIGVPGKTIPGATAWGEHFVSWDGTGTDGSIVAPGPFAVQVTGSPVLGSTLSLTVDQSSLSFQPSQGQSLQISYRLSEPVKRLTAGQAKLTSLVCSPSGKVVRILASEAVVENFDNNPYDNITCGSNILVWDGKDDNENVVPPGDYHITLSAVDSAGVGCQSDTKIINVSIPCASECNLSVFPGDSSNQNLVSGYTTTPGSAIQWSDSVGASGALTTNYNGDFSFVIGDLPGPHTVTVTATPPGSQRSVSEIVETFTNNFQAGSVTVEPGGGQSGKPGYFCPNSGESVVVTSSSRIADTIDAVVFDPFATEECINKSDPIRIEQQLNGEVDGKVIRTLYTSHDVSEGAFTVSWDGRDDYGNVVIAGPYIIRVNRSNTDGCRGLSLSNAVVVENHAPDAPVISDVEHTVTGCSVVVSWVTNVPTQGAVLYQMNGEPVARAVSQSNGVCHRVFLPVIDYNATYTYWVVSRDEQGRSAVSAEHTVSTPAGPGIDAVKAQILSETSTSIRWDSALPSTTTWYVDYGIVDSSTGSLTWHTLCAGNGTSCVDLNNLVPNVEYAYRVRAIALDSSIAAVSRYGSFVTKFSSTIVRILNLSDGDVVSGSVEVSAEAYDTVTRFSQNGILRADVIVDGEVMASLIKDPISNTYSGTFDSAQLSPGFHRLTVRVKNDFLQISKVGINIIVDESTQQNQSQWNTDLLQSSLGITPSMYKSKFKTRRVGIACETDVSLPRGKKIALIYIDEGATDDQKAYLRDFANIEKKSYEKKGYKVSILESGTLDYLLSEGIHENRLKAFTYFGHGAPATVAGGNIMTAESLAVAIYRYHASHTGSCTAQFDYFRLLSCMSGMSQKFGQDRKFSPFYDSNPYTRWWKGNKFTFKSFWSLVSPDKTPHHYWATAFGMNKLTIWAQVRMGLD